MPIFYKLGSCRFGYRRGIAIREESLVYLLLRLRDTFCCSFLGRAVWVQAGDAWNNALVGNTLLLYGDNGEVGNHGQAVDDGPE
jgi:hypothetical protein